MPMLLGVKLFFSGNLRDLTAQPLAAEMGTGASCWTRFGVVVRKGQSEAHDLVGVHFKTHPYVNCEFIASCAGSPKVAGSLEATSPYA